jgi:hypothetical protein
MEKTIRSNGKWSKISGKRGAWNCAKGWEGQLNAARLLRYPTKEGAMIAAQNWLKD